MDKETKDMVLGVADFVENDFDTVLDIALCIASFVPGATIIVKIIELLIKHKCKIMTAAKLAKKSTEIGEHKVKKVELSLAEQKMLSANNDSKKRFLSLVDDALDDGIVTDEERAYLIPKGLQAGYSLQEIEQMLKINH